MAYLGWFLVAFGLVATATSVYPFLYLMATNDDPTINPVTQGILMALAGFVGLVLAALGGSVIFKARRGQWPAGF
jgi:hypothetical protein